MPEGVIVDEAQAGEADGGEAGVEAKTMGDIKSLAISILRVDYESQALLENLKPWVITMPCENWPSKAPNRDANVQENVIQSSCGLNMRVAAHDS